MPGRHTPAVRDERESLMLEIFRRNLKQSAAKANAEFKTKTGTMMRNKRVYELRNVARAEAEKAAATPPVIPPPAQRTSRRVKADKVEAFEEAGSIYIIIKR